MAKNYDLTSQLESKKSTITIGKKKYEITNGFIDYFKMDELREVKDTMSIRGFITEFFNIAVGEKAAHEVLSAIYSKDMSLAISVAIQGSMDEEAVEKDDSQGA